MTRYGARHENLAPLPPRLAPGRAAAPPGKAQFDLTNLSGNRRGRADTLHWIS